MSGKRKTTGEERALFEQMVKEARPRLPAPLPDLPPKIRALPRNRNTKGEGGLDGGTAAKLRRGLLEPEARLDLHGYTEDAAHLALTRFLTGARRRGLRLVLVVTGKGGRPDDDAPFTMDYGRRGVLKAAVPRWLKEAALASLIAVTMAAHRKHGGTGALYIYLRKPPRA
jgi:DNA-nicking Smr family endonuclease